MPQALPITQDKTGGLRAISQARRDLFSTQQSYWKIEKGIK
jgi:hypothetical protein